MLGLSSCETTESKRHPTPPPAATAPTLTASAAPPPPKPQDTSPKADVVEALIARAEKEYKAGQENYSAGHLDAAKQNFDRAVTLLLEGPVAVRSDPRLQREFEKIVEGVNGLELLALKEGDGFNEQAAEPAPIDEANEVTFPVDPNVSARAAADVQSTPSDLPLVMNDIVASYVNFFSRSPKGHGTAVHSLTRAGRYREMISRILREEGVPQDLIYLAQAESGFKNLALSRAGARGMWQFMAGRASEYGLERNWWVDERQDPEKATRAAARHLRDLYAQFGDWYLALAAYNSGPGNVQRGVERTGYADFWELYRRDALPRETKNYVPIIIAATIVAKNPAQYGLGNVIPELAPEVDTVKVDYPVDLRLVAECVDSSVEALQELNPSLLRMTTPKEGSFDLKLPGGTAEKYRAAIAAIPVDKRVWWRYYKVVPGDTLQSVAKRYRTSAAAITDANGLQSTELAPDSKLILPMAPGRSLDDPEHMAFSKRPTRYRVRNGDTVLSVADDFGVPPSHLRKWNHLKGNELHKGRVLVIYRPVGEGEAAGGRAGKASKSRSKSRLQTPKGEKRTHTVRPGETLFKHRGRQQHHGRSAAPRQPADLFSPAARRQAGHPARALIG
ncbi:MAG: transglycosylase SLT domain-containing protein [Acidobacteriota bacterium]|nr:transglycosylase SLT domain-containing protein [Acidobacteriota bacterium]